MSLPSPDARREIARYGQLIGANIFALVALNLVSVPASYRPALLATVGVVLVATGAMVPWDGQLESYTVRLGAVGIGWLSIGFAALWWLGVVRW